MKYSNDIILKDQESLFCFEYLKWDSRFFNKKSYILNARKSILIPSEKIRSLIDDKFSDSFVTVKLNTQVDFAVVNLLQQCGFDYIDSELTLELIDDKSSIDRGRNDGVLIEKSTSNADIPYSSLGTAFRFTRFHTDLHIANDKADKLWINYLKNYILSDSRHMFIAKIESQVAGVALVNVDNAVATLFFISVVDRYRGRGVGSALLNHIIDCFDQYTIRTETQVKNLGALNFYIANGLSKIFMSSTVMHRW